MTLNDNLSPGLLQPHTSPTPVKRVWGPGAAIGYSLVILAVFIFAQGIVVAIPAISSLASHAGAGISSTEDLTKLIMDDLNARLGLWQSIATIFSGIIGTGLIIIFIRARKGAGIAEYLGLKRVSIRTILAVIAITVATIGLVDLVQFLLGVTNSEPVMNKIYTTSVWLPLFWIAVVMFAPLFEEALFRGFLFESLRQSWWGVYGAVMLTSFAWSILHGFQYGLGGIVYIFVLGIVMGIVRWRTKSIWTTFTMHAVVNLLASIALATGLSY
jgi:uncharacterized protein